MSRPLPVLAALLSLTAVAAVTVPAGSATNKRGHTLLVRLAAAPALVPLANAIAKRYGLGNTGITISVKPLESFDDARAFAARSIDLALSDVKPPAGERGATAIAVAPFVFVANHADALGNLTFAQLRAVYTGSATNWRDVGGGRQAIHTIVPDVASEEARLIDATILHGSAQPAPDATSHSPQDAIERVKATRGAIALVPLAVARAANADVTLVSIEGATPDEAHVGDGSYGLVQYVYAIRHASASSAPGRLVTFIADDRELLHAFGFIAASELGPGARQP